MEKMKRWIGKIAVVTGASSGIGAVIAKDLADRGIVVVALARRFDKLQELTKKTKGVIHPKQCDLQNEKEILSVFRWVESRLGGVDIMINNSGVANNSPLMTGETDKWQTIFDTNVRGLSICTREALKSMRKRGDNGHIFHINSVAGHVVTSYPGFFIGMYIASKHAVTALTEALRIELQQANSKIKITSVSPGDVATELPAKMAREMSGQGDSPQTDAAPNVGDMPLDSFLQPEDISDAIIYSLGTRPNVQVHEILIQPIGQTYS